MLPQPLEIGTRLQSCWKCINRKYEIGNTKYEEKNQKLFKVTFNLQKLCFLLVAKRLLVSFFLCFYVVKKNYSQLP